MRILITHFHIQDWGGIVNYSEFMARGLKQLGHTVDSVMLKNKGITGVPKIKDRSGQQGWEYGDGLGLWMHQKSGWEGMFQLNYAANMEQWGDTADSYDLILHHIPVPTCTKANKGDEAWLQVFKNHMTPQLVVVHDGNMQKLYPHILNIVDDIEGVVCVHDAAFNSCSVLPVRRAFIPNPHNVPEDLSVKEPYDRSDTILSLQTFKRWKRVDDLIRAIAYMDEFTNKMICGGGIEYHYMTSKDKCKPEYINEDGSRIWDKALLNGMDYLGYITTEERDKHLSDAKLLVDPSWSKNYSKLGCHFNRVMVEAMIQGCVPVCTDLAMKGSFLFEANRNYIEIPYDSTPEQYAKILDDAIEDECLLHGIQDNNIKMLSLFACETIAQTVLDFADGQGGEVGEVTDEIYAAAEKKMEHFDEFNS